METVKKPRGLAAMTPEARAAAIEKGRLTRQANKAARLASTGTSLEELRDAREKPEKLNNVLDRFRYTANPDDVAIWRAGRDISPVSPPEKTQKDYPELEWKLLSKKKINRLGMGYDGWQVFKDSAHPEGIERSNDSIFGVRPKSLGDDHRKAKAERAQAALSTLAESRLEEMEKRAAAARQGGDEVAAVIHGHQMESGRLAGEGIVVGRHRMARRAERLRDSFEKRAQETVNRKYVFMGK